MKTTAALFYGLLVSATGLAQYNSDNLKVQESVSYSYKNLKLYPVLANEAFLNAHKDISKYTPLQKALSESKVVVTEIGESLSAINRRPVHATNNANSGSVNTLQIENTSNDTIMIMAGEVVKGGKQDRVLAQDMILLPRSGKQDIPVFCVEHGRWQYSADAQKANNTFYGYSNVSTMSVRKVAVVDKNQQKVWDNVAEVTSKNAASSQSGSYTALDTSQAFNRELKGYVDHFSSILKGQDRVIGMVACTGDKVIGCDMFATPEIFGQYADNLLNSYSTEAITHGSVATTGYATVQAYLSRFLSDESHQESEVQKNGTMLKSRGKKLHLATFE